MNRGYIFTICLFFPFCSLLYSVPKWFEKIFNKETHSVQIGEITIPSKIENSKVANALIHQVVCLLATNAKEVDDAVEKQEYLTRIQELLDLTPALDGRPLIRSPLNVQHGIYSKHEIKTTLPSILQNVAGWVQDQKNKKAAMLIARNLQLDLGAVTAFAVGQQRRLDELEREEQEESKAAGKKRVGFLERKSS